MSSYVIAAPEALAAASADLSGLQEALRAAAAAAAPSTTAILPAAADEVSAAITQVLSSHAAEFQALNARTLLFHSEFAQYVLKGANAYLGAELLNVVDVGQKFTLFSPVKALTGRPAFGNGTDGAPNSGKAGTDGGWFGGNGGN